MCSQLPNQVLKNISIIDSPGILSGGKHRISRVNSYSPFKCWCNPSLQDAFSFLQRPWEIFATSMHSLSWEGRSSQISGCFQDPSNKQWGSAKLSSSSHDSKLPA
ncbi:uncharacterized protein AAEQ78_020677 [Lycaon pictus]